MKKPGKFYQPTWANCLNGEGKGIRLRSVIWEELGNFNTEPLEVLAVSSVSYFQFVVYGLIPSFWLYQDGFQSISVRVLTPWIGSWKPDANT